RTTPRWSTRDGSSCSARAPPRGPSGSISSGSLPRAARRGGDEQRDRRAGARARARARARAPRRPRRELVPVCRARTVHATSWAPRYEFARWQAGGHWAGALRQLLPPSALHRDVHDDVEVGGLGRDEAVVLEGEQVAVGVAEGAAAGGEP